MSKSKKRTISALLKNRQSGKFSSGGFDLLGEGDRIVAAIDDKTTQPKTAPSLPSLEEFSTYADALYKATASLEENTATADFAIEDPAMEAIARRLYSSDFTEDKSAIVGKVIADEAIAGDAIAKSIVSKIIANPAIVNASIASHAIARSAMAENPSDIHIVTDSAIVNKAVVDPAIVNSPIEESAMGYFAIEEYAVVKDVVANSAMANKSIVKGAIESTTIVEDAIEMFDVAKKDEVDAEGIIAKKDFIKKTDLKLTKLPSIKTLKGIGTRQAYQESHEELERLKANSGTTTSVDNYVFDTLFKEINNASESMVYLYLWRRTYGSGKKNVELSYQVLADAIGVSKRGGQEVLKRLHEKKLIKIDLEGKTGIPSYEILCPWQKK